jgi:hypothetical protein
MLMRMLFVLLLLLLLLAGAQGAGAGWLQGQAQQYGQPAAGCWRAHRC